jgi:peptidoglycan/xylan/chitin deacetylase (PgdA/CDA1 family)
LNPRLKDNLTVLPLMHLKLSSNTRAPIILMYHGTPNIHPLSKYSIRADRFNAHLRYLKRHDWHTVLFRELQNVSVLPEKTVVLTFDDGYVDNYEGAFLPLVESKINATWFITTDCIGKHSHWTGSLSPQTQMLTVEQLFQMEKAGMEIGSHTCSHPDLTTLSYQQQLDEMTKSKLILESIIHSKISSFAYPYGKYNADSIVAVKDSDYQMACTTTARPGFGSENNPLLFRRIPILANDSVTTLAFKLAFSDWYLRKWSLLGFFRKVC